MSFDAILLAIALLRRVRLVNSVFSAHLHHLQVLESLLYKFLHTARVGLGLVVAKGIPRTAQGVLAKVVCGELLRLAKELAVLSKALANGRDLDWRGRPGRIAGA